MNTRIKIALSFSVIAIVAIIIYFFSANVPWVCDDIRYQFNLAADSDIQRINSIVDIFSSQWEHYMTVNGRYVAHWLVQFFCGLLGQTTFSICNAFIYIAYIMLVLKLGKGDIKEPLVIISASILTLIACDIPYGPAFQIGYVWMFVLTFIWLYLFFKVNTNSFLQLSLLFIFSLIAGNGHEAINIGVSGAIIIFMLFNFKKITTTQWVLLLGFGIGTLLICISPATLSRVAKVAVKTNDSIFMLLTSLRVFLYFSHYIDNKTHFSFSNIKRILS